MARRRTSSSRSNSRGPQWLSTVRTIVSAFNAIARLFSMFKGWRGKPQPTEREASSRRDSDLPKVPPQPTVARNSPGAATSTSRSKGAPAPAVEPPDAPRPVGSDGGIPDLFKQQRGDVVVTASGRCVKVLPDDLDDSDGSGQHQRFLVELLDRNHTTVRIAHNLKFGRVPVREGQIVTFRGEYEYTDKGGCIHWTHHDPKKWHEDGWIELDGKRYG